MTPLVLASTSPYRKELLLKLGVPFQTSAPDCDEDNYKSRIQDPKELATTLAFEKAKSLSSSDNCVIGGDQVIALGSEILGKPGSFEKACEQLSRMQGRTHQVITAINVIYKNRPHSILDITEIQMRRLSRDQIENYVQKDQAFDCAGSYKIEKSGLALFEKIKTEDFSAIQGIPLIHLTSHLLQLGYQILSAKDFK